MVGEFGKGFGETRRREAVGFELRPIRRKPEFLVRMGEAIDVVSRFEVGLAVDPVGFLEALDSAPS